MSYLISRMSREEFIKTRGAECTQSNARVALNMFDHFCQGMYDKTGEWKYFIKLQMFEIYP